MRDGRHKCSKSASAIAVQTNWTKKWLNAIYTKFKPYDMRVKIIDDRGQDSFDSNTAYFYCVRENNGQRNFQKCTSFNFTNGAAFNLDKKNHLMHEDDEYILIDEEHDSYRIILKNKKTGFRLNLSTANLKMVDEPYYFSLYDKDGNNAKLGEEENIDHCDKLDIQDALDDAEGLNGETSAPEEWKIFIKVPEEDKFLKKPKADSVNQKMEFSEWLKTNWDVLATCEEVVIPEYVTNIKSMPTNFAACKKLTVLADAKEIKWIPLEFFGVLITEYVIAPVSGKKLKNGLFKGLDYKEIKK